jgi:DNA-directed RNA polymerase subunit RPC12/RpoP
MIEIVNLVILLFMQCFFLTFLIVALHSQVKARKQFNKGKCSECDGMYFPVNNHVLGRAYICPDCGSYVLFPLDFSNVVREVPENIFEESENEEEPTIEKI